MPAIVTRDLTKHYGAIHAVDGLSFEVVEGEVYALLGHNGAGKSTTVEMPPRWGSRGIAPRSAPGTASTSCTSSPSSTC